MGVFEVLVCDCIYIMVRSPQHSESHFASFSNNISIQVFNVRRSTSIVLSSRILNNTKLFARWRRSRGVTPECGRHSTCTVFNISLTVANTVCRLTFSNVSGAVLHTNNIPIHNVMTHVCNFGGQCSEQLIYYWRWPTLYDVDI